MQKLQMIRVEADVDGRPMLLFKIFPSGIEIKAKGKTFFLNIEKETLKKLIDNFCKDDKIRVI